MGHVAFFVRFGRGERVRFLPYRHQPHPRWSWYDCVLFRGRTHQTAKLTASSVRQLSTSRRPRPRVRGATQVHRPARVVLRRDSAARPACLEMEGERPAAQHRSKPRQRVMRRDLPSTSHPERAVLRDEVGSDGRQRSARRAQHLAMPCVCRLQGSVARPGILAFRRGG